MNFFERILTGRLFFKKKNTEITEEKFPKAVVKFTFMDRTYILESFELNFTQEINSKGQPGGLPRGGIMTITMSETPDYFINEWMSREELLRDGLIRILPNKGKVNEGAGLTISFKDAYCIRYIKKINTLETGLLTTIVVSPRSVKIGNEEFENRWKKQESLSHYIRSI